MTNKLYPDSFKVNQHCNKLMLLTSSADTGARKPDTGLLPYCAKGIFNNGMPSVL